MNDEGGGAEKIFAVPSSKLTRRYDTISNYADLPSLLLAFCPASPEVMIALSKFAKNEGRPDDSDCYRH